MAACNGETAPAAMQNGDGTEKSSSYDRAGSCPTKFPSREQQPGQPLYAQILDSGDMLDSGDHILHQSSKPPYRIMFYSALVMKRPDSTGKMSVITNSVIGVTKKEVYFDELQNVHKVEYDSCRYSGEESIERANRRFKLKEKSYHALYNNSHFFVTWCKTGREYPLTDILVEISQDPNVHNAVLVPVVYKIAVTSVKKLSKGDHVILNSQHYLVDSVELESKTFSAYTVNRDNKQVDWYEELSKNRTLHVITCSEHLEPSDSAAVLQRASVELKRKTVWQGSDFFVTAVKCGRAHAVDMECVLDADVAITGCKLITPNERVKEGDHLMFDDKKNATHSVLVYKCLDHTQVTVHPPVDEGEVIDLTTIPEVFRVDYSQSLPADEVLIRGKSKQGTKLLKKSHSNGHNSFVTWTKTGKEIPLSSDFIKTKFTVERLQTTDEVKPGDHIMEYSDSKRRHFMAVDRIEKSMYTVIFCQAGGLICEQAVDFDCTELYRIVYPRDSISNHEAVERAKAQLGQWKHSPWDQMTFIMQAKSVSSECQITVTHIKRVIAKTDKVCEGDHLILKRTQNPSQMHTVQVVQWMDNMIVTVKPPLDKSNLLNLKNYEEIHKIECRHDPKRAGAFSGSSTDSLSLLDFMNNRFGLEYIHSLSQVCVGDYIIDYENYKHFIVTEVVKRSVFKVEFSGGDSATLDLNSRQLHRLVQIQKSQSAHRATALQAKLEIGQQMSIRWDQLLVSIQSKSYMKPMSKSQVTSFSQLKLGDYLVVAPRMGHSHHYIVAFIGLPDTCTAIECHQGKVLQVALSPPERDKYPKYYRLNYEPGMCISAKESVMLALSLVDKKFARKSFVHFLKTKEEGTEIESSVEVDSKTLHAKDTSFSRTEIAHFSELCIGDYLIKEQRMTMSHHYIIISISSSGNCTAVECYQGKISKVQFPLTSALQEKHSKFYRINYDQKSCISVDVSIKTALLLVDKSFVHLLKTDEEDAEIDEHSIEVAATAAHNYAIPQYIKPVNSLADIHGGDHIVYTVTKPPFHPIYCSALVLETRTEETGEIDFITLEKSGLVTKKFDFSFLSGLGKVIYQGCPLSQNNAMIRAKQASQFEKVENYHEDHNNSHHFVTRIKTGKESSLMEILRIFVKSDDQRIKALPKLKPVLTKVAISGLDDLKAGDHIMIDSEHFLAKSLNIEEKTFEIYSIAKKTVVKSQKYITICTKKYDTLFGVHRIEYDARSRVFDPRQTLKIAEDERLRDTEWQRSDLFVTTVKCGAGFIIDDRCIMPKEIQVHCTDIAGNTSVDNGDHLLIRDEETGELCSVLVYRFYHQTKIEVLPSLSQTYERQIIDLTQYEEKYRVNYTHSLPSTEVNMRAVSQTGQELLSQCSDDCFTYIHWAKTGRESRVSPEKLVQDPRRLALIRPTTYGKIFSPDEIQVGDHLFWDKDKLKSHRKHVLVTERNVGGEFTVIYYSKTKFKEKQKNFGEMGLDTYRINYPEALPADVAIKRARSKKGDTDFKPLGRLWFVRWAKTGSQEGLEVGFLKNNTKPVTKSRISCFSQLNPGDYLVKEPKLNFYHHYIVLSVESPSQCTAVESWQNNVRRVMLTWQNFSDTNQHPWYYRVNYEKGVCVPPEESIFNAQNLINTLHLHPFSKCSRENFVHHLKTGEAAVIDTDELLDDRILLQRERITSAMELKRGDHIERPLSLAPHHAQHHMWVVDPIDDEHCEVIHYMVHKSAAKVLKFKKGDVVREVVNIFDQNHVSRIRYPERVDPISGMSTLLEVCEGKGKEALKIHTGMEEYNLKENNCEHLVTLATIGFPLSIQVHQVIHQALQCSKAVVKNIGNSVVSHTGKCGTGNMGDFGVGHQIAIQV